MEKKGRKSEGEEEEEIVWAGREGLEPDLCSHLIYHMEDERENCKGHSCHPEEVVHLDSTGAPATVLQVSAHSMFKIVLSLS